MNPRWRSNCPKLLADTHNVQNDQDRQGGGLLLQTSATPERNPLCYLWRARETVGRRESAGGGRGAWRLHKRSVAPWEVYKPKLGRQSGGRASERPAKTRAAMSHPSFLLSSIPSTFLVHPWCPSLVKVNKKTSTCTYQHEGVWVRLIAHPHIQVRATIERFLPAGATFRVASASESQ